MISSITRPRGSRKAPCHGMKGESKTRLRRALLTPDYAFAFFLAAQRAFIRADNFFLAAALTAGRALVFLGADLPFHFAHRCFIASEIRLRAATLIVRRRLRRRVGAACDFGGRPRRGADGPASPSSAEMASSMRARSDLSSANMLSRSTRILSVGATVGQCSSKSQWTWNAELRQGEHSTRQPLPP